MKFHLIATSIPYTIYDNSKTEADYLSDYIKMLDEAASEGPAYIIDNGKVYVNIFYGSDMAILEKAVSFSLMDRALLAILTAWSPRRSNSEKTL